MSKTFFENLPPEPIGVTIADAYNQLTSEALAVWLRMHVLTPEEMTGRTELAKLLNYSAYVDKIFRELRYKGFLAIYTRWGCGKRSVFILKKRLMLAGEDRVIKMSKDMASWDTFKLGDDYIPTEDSYRSKANSARAKGATGTI